MKSDVGPYTILPAWVLRSGISAGAVALYAELGMHADNETGECFPGHDALAKTLGVTTRTVHRWQTELEEHGCLHVQNRGHRSNLYTLVFSQPDTDVQLQPDISDRTQPDADVLQNQTQGNQTQEPTPERPRKRDAVFDALTQVCDIDPEQTTKRERRAIGVAAAEIRGAWTGLRELEPAAILGEVRRRAANYRRHFPQATLTPNALAKHWGLCRHGPGAVLTPTEVIAQRAEMSPDELAESNAAHAAAFADYRKRRATG